MTTKTRKFRLLLGVAVLGLVTTAAAFGAGMQTLKVSAQMNARQVVKPRKPKGNVAHASGTFVGTLKSRGSRWNLTWRITYTGLDHPKIVIADIHYGVPGQFGPVVVRLCGPCKSGQHGVVRVKARRIDGIKAGNTFITLITNRNPNGEIRGQIKAG
jgi:CHRD domain-containing protein